MDEPYWLDKTRGYIDLAMYEEASRELEKLSPDKQLRPETQEMRIIIKLDQEMHGEALDICKALCREHPDNHAGFIQGAFCLHALGQTSEAIEHLQAGPESLRDEPVYFYNLACYDLALGKSQSALTWLRQSIEMDRSYRAKALADQDLAPICEDI